MTPQGVAVAVIVPLCALYAVWQLIGASARRRLAAWLARGPWPSAWRRRIARAAVAARACGCDACDGGVPTGERRAQAVVVHRRGR